MHRRTVRLNRILLTLLGLLFLALGAFFVARHYDLIDRLPSDDRLYSASQQRFLHQHDWIFYVAGGVGVVAALIVLYWLLVQPQIDRVRALRVDPDLSQPGRTAMAADVLTDVVEADVEDYPGVVGARALIIGAVDAPELILRVSAKPVTDLAGIHRRILDEALPAMRTALDAPDTPAQVHLHIAGRRTAKRVVL